MFEQLTKNQQLLNDELSDDELECVAGGTANAAGITTAHTNQANLAISDAGITAIDVNYDAYKTKVNYNQPS